MEKEGRELAFFPPNVAFSSFFPQLLDQVGLGHPPQRALHGEEADAERSDGNARGQIAEHRIEPEALEKRHGDHACAEKGDDRDEIDAVAASPAMPRS